MKTKKTTMAICAVAIGATMMITGAVADVALGSGYQKLKAAAKTTTKVMSDKSFTLLGNFEMRIDGAVMQQENMRTAIDRVNRRSETTETSTAKGETREHYRYSDANMTVFRDSDEDTYYASETGDYDAFEGSYTDPFDDPYAADFEKIIDAAVGTLQDIISVEEKDGKQIYAGTVTDAEIPALMNAVASFAAKYSLCDEYTMQHMGLPFQIENDVYVDTVSGKAVQNADGVLENLIGYLSISGKDESGTAHNIVLAMSLELSDMDATTVAAFDVNRENVEYTAYTDSEKEESFSQKNVGMYTCAIVERMDDAYEKTGECSLAIEAVENGRVKGSYAETHTNGDTLEFDFDVVPQEDEPTRINIPYTNADGEEATAILYISDAPNMRITLDVEMVDDGRGWYGEGETYYLVREF